MDSRDAGAARDAIRPLIEAGATQVVLADRSPHEPGKLRRLVDEVIAPLSARSPV
jgi:3-methyladenine DNA glycosylase AlkC